MSIDDYENASLTDFFISEKYKNASLSAGSININPNNYRKYSLSSLSDLEGGGKSCQWFWAGFGNNLLQDIAKRLYNIKLNGYNGGSSVGSGTI